MTTPTKTNTANPIPPTPPNNATGTAPPKRARAILFGLNYEHEPDATLRGCTNDVRNMSRMLRDELLPKGSVVQAFCDDNAAQRRDTTAQGILRIMYELAVASHRDSLDLVWIHFSGHGSYIVDRNGDEKDKRDECLVPSDYKKAGVISDDVLHSLFKQFSPNTRVVFICDSCHSGTIGDVKYDWESAQRVTVVNIACTVPAKVLTLSGCMDDQTSADAFNVLGDSTFVGAMTSCLLLVLKETPAVKSDAFLLLRSLRAKLKERGFQQVPKLCTSYNLIRDRPFLPPLK
jgi:hypothetical protein